MHISQVIILLGEEWTTSFYKREPHMSWFSASLFKDRFALRYEENMTAGWGTHLSLQTGGFMGFLDPLIWLPDGPAFGNHQLGTLQSPGVFLLRQFSTSFKKKKKRCCPPPFPNFVYVHAMRAWKKWSRKFLSGSPAWGGNRKYEMYRMFIKT